MSSQANEAVVRRWFDEFNRGNADAIDELFTADFIAHISSVPEPIRGPQAFKEFVTQFRAAFPDVQFTLEDLIAQGDKVAVRYTWRGTHQGAFEGIPPTGKQVTGSSLAIGRLAGGKTEELWDHGDDVNFLQQLGVMPGPEQAGQ